MKEKQPAILALEDGTVFYGQALGKVGEAVGEVVFNTSMTGYQEVLTDPSYAGQIVAMTYPQIGNYGVNPEDNESRQPFVEGFVVRESSKVFSNWRANASLEDFLSKHNIVGIEGIDTRALTKHIRIEGAMKAVLSSIDLNESALIAKAKASPGLLGRDLVKDVTVKKSYIWGEKKQAKFKVVAFDFGIKLNILRSLEAVGCWVQVVPGQTTSNEVLELDPDGILLSNGPGDPQGVSYAIETVSELLGKKPIFGICLGQQILALALGGQTYKLKFGHRGGNQPVKNLLTSRVEITTQNHGFAVDEESLRVGSREWGVGSVEITHINLNDGTVEGLRCLDIPAFSVQYHPEASPGPHDAKYLFEQFAELMRSKLTPVT